MIEWLDELSYDPLPFLLGSTSSSIALFTRRDILEQHTGSEQILWESPQAKRITASQKPDGRWKYPGGGKRLIRTAEDYDQLETYRQLGLLVEKFGFDRTHPGIRQAAKFLFAHQAEEGDFRGIYGRQFSPNYSAAITELLVKAGYGDDGGIERCYRWLLSMRQADGGWAIPFRTVASPSLRNWKKALHSYPIYPDVSRPFSHLVTGVVLRAFAAHDRYAKSAEARAAGELVTQRFFKADTYADRKAPEFWERVSFPFWFTDVVSVLDSLSKLGFSKEDARIKNALVWLKERQITDGSFRLKLLRDRDKDLRQWVCLAICRLLKRFNRPGQTR